MLPAPMLDYLVLRYREQLQRPPLALYTRPNRSRCLHPSRQTITDLSQADFTIERRFFEHYATPQTVSLIITDLTPDTIYAPQYQHPVPAYSLAVSTRHVELIPNTEHQTHYGAQLTFFYVDGLDGHRPFSPEHGLVVIDADKHILYLRDSGLDLQAAEIINHLPRK